MRSPCCAAGTEPETGGVSIDELDDGPEAGGGLSVLGEAECWEHLTGADVGRLAFVVAGEPEIFPVNFVVDRRTLVFRTAEGTKLAGLTIAPSVAFEVDGFDAAGGVAWSVIARGQARRLDRFDDLMQAEQLAVFPWFASPKPYFIRIEHVEVTGRKFLATGHHGDASHP